MTDPQPPSQHPSDIEQLTPENSAAKPEAVAEAATLPSPGGPAGPTSLFTTPSAAQAGVHPPLQSGLDPPLTMTEEATRPGSASHISRSMLPSSGSRKQYEKEQHEDTADETRDKRQRPEQKKFRASFGSGAKQANVRPLWFRMADWPSQFQVFGDWPEVFRKAADRQYLRDTLAVAPQGLPLFVEATDKRIAAAIADVLLRGETGAIIIDLDRDDSGAKIDSLARPFEAPLADLLPASGLSDDAAVVVMLGDNGWMDSFWSKFLGSGVDAFVGAPRRIVIVGPPHALFRPQAVEAQNLPRCKVPETDMLLTIVGVRFPDHAEDRDGKSDGSLAWQIREGVWGGDARRRRDVTSVLDLFLRSETRYFDEFQNKQKASGRPDRMTKWDTAFETAIDGDVPKLAALFLATYFGGADGIRSQLFDLWAHDLIAKYLAAYPPPVPAPVLATDGTPIPLPPPPMTVTGKTLRELDIETRTDPTSGSRIDFTLQQNCRDQMRRNFDRFGDMQRGQLFDLLVRRGPTTECGPEVARKLADLAALVVMSRGVTDQPVNANNRVLADTVRQLLLGFLDDASADAGKQLHRLFETVNGSGEFLAQFADSLSVITGKSREQWISAIAGVIVNLSTIPRFLSDDRGGFGLFSPLILGDLIAADRGAALDPSFLAGVLEMPRDGRRLLLELLWSEPRLAVQQRLAAQSSGLSRNADALDQRAMAFSKPRLVELSGDAVGVVLAAASDGNRPLDRIACRVLFRLVVRLCQTIAPLGVGHRSIEKVSGGRPLDIVLAEALWSRPMRAYLGNVTRAEIRALLDDVKVSDAAQRAALNQEGFGTAYDIFRVLMCLLLDTAAAGPHEPSLVEALENDLLFSDVDDDLPWLSPIFVLFLLTYARAPVIEDDLTSVEPRSMLSSELIAFLRTKPGGYPIREWLSEARDVFDFLYDRYDELLQQDNYRKVPGLRAAARRRRMQFSWFRSELSDRIYAA